MRDYIFVILIGEGSNCKGTFIRILVHKLGDYATTVDLALLTGFRHVAHDAATSVLRLRRLAIPSETYRRVRLAEAPVNKAHRRRYIPASRLYENPWQFGPTHSIRLQTNHLPESSGRDRGIWRRIRVVPWTSCIDGNADDTLDGELRSEAPWIFNWSLDGALLYLERDLAEPSEIIKATLERRQHADVLAHCMDDCVFLFDPRTHAD